MWPSLRTFTFSNRWFMAVPVHCSWLSRFISRFFAVVYGCPGSFSWLSRFNAGSGYYRPRINESPVEDPMTLQQVADLRAEGDELHAFLDTIPEDQWARGTPFKGRTINWVVKHLHDADRWTVHSVTDPDGFRAWRDQLTNLRLDDPASRTRPGAAGTLAILLRAVVRCARSRRPRPAGALVRAGHGHPHDGDGPARWRPGRTARTSTTCLR